MSILSRLEEMLTKISESEWLELAINTLRAREYGLDDWEPTSDDRALVHVNAKSAEELSKEIPEIVKGAYGETAEDGWLDLHHEDFFEITRKPAEFTVRRINVRNESGASATITTGERYAETDDGRSFEAYETKVIANGVTSPVLFRAVVAGAAGNDPVSSWTWQTPLAGVSLLEPPTNAVVESGADAESNDDYRRRGPLRWGERGAGGNDDAYEFWAQQASNEIRRVKVLEHTPNPGDVTIYVAGDSGTVSDDAVAAAQAYIYPGPSLGGKAPNCVSVYVFKGVVNTINLVGTVTALPSELSAARTAFVRELGAYEKEAGFDAIVRRGRLESLIWSKLSRDKKSKNNVVLSQPVGDVDLAANEIPKFNVSGLVWVEAT